MSKDTKTGKSDANATSPEEIQDEDLDKADGGFALSDMFTKSVKTPVTPFNDLDATVIRKIDTQSLDLEEVTANFVRKRPGRKSF